MSIDPRMYTYKHIATFTFTWQAHRLRLGLPQVATYDIYQPELVTLIIPGALLGSGRQLVAAPPIALQVSAPRPAAHVCSCAPRPA